MIHYELNEGSNKEITQLIDSVSRKVIKLRSALHSEEFHYLEFSLAILRDIHTTRQLENAQILAQAIHPLDIPLNEKMLPIETLKAYRLPSLVNLKIITEFDCKPILTGLRLLQVLLVYSAPLNDLNDYYHFTSDLT